ncbi:MAG: hypothetical protein AB7Q17_14225 [Phycisphaerae bacterium]
MAATATIPKPTKTSEPTAPLDEARALAARVVELRPGIASADAPERRAALLALKPLAERLRELCDAAIADERKHSPRAVVDPNAAAARDTAKQIIICVRESLFGLKDMRSALIDAAPAAYVARVRALRFATLGDPRPLLKRADVAPGTEAVATARAAADLVGLALGPSRLAELRRELDKAESALLTAPWGELE